MLHLNMFIQCSTVKREGKDGRNRKLVESYRDPETGKPRSRTVQKLEKLAVLERARLIYRHGGQKHLDQQEWLAMLAAGDFQQPFVESKIGDCYAGAGAAVLRHYLQDSGLEGLLKKHLGNKAGRLVRDMLTLQILRPSSKLSYVQARLSTLNYILDGKEDCEQDAFYRSLDLLENHFTAIRDELNQALAQPGRLLLYDLSNSYFSGRKAELGGYGDSKEKRFDRYLVSYGLVMNEDNLPLDIQVWKGGTADVQTVHQTFVGWQDKYQARQAIWVADRAMSGAETIESVEQLDLSYITGLPAASQQALLQQIHETAPGLFDDTLTEFIENDKRYVLCRHYSKGYRKEQQHQRHRRKVREALLKIQASPRNKDQAKLYHRAMKVLEQYQQTDCWSLYFEANADQKGEQRYRMTFRLNREQARVNDRLGHYYVLQTNLDVRQATKQEIQDYYKRLFKVEKSFRTIKSDLEIRPIRHWKAPRIKAHIYLNFLALWLVKKIENAWKQKGITAEVTATLREWDQVLGLNEILDKTNGKLIELQWNQGKNTLTAREKIKAFGEMGHISPRL